MPTSSCSLYNVKVDSAPDEIHKKLKNQREIREIDGKKYKLRTLFSDLKLKKDALWGKIDYETLKQLPQIEGPPNHSISAAKAKFAFCPAPRTCYLLVFAHRGNSELVAKKINNALNQGNTATDAISNRSIQSKHIQDFQRRHPNHTLKVVSWKYPAKMSINIITIQGNDLGRFDDPQIQEYGHNGSLRYVMVKLHDRPMTIRLSEQGTITFYGKILNDEKLRFIRREILSMF